MDPTPFEPGFHPDLRLGLLWVNIGDCIRYWKSSMLSTVWCTMPILCSIGVPLVKSIKKHQKASKSIDSSNDSFGPDEVLRSGHQDDMMASIVCDRLGYKKPSGMEYAPRNVGGVFRAEMNFPPVFDALTSVTAACCCPPTRSEISGL